MRISHLPPNPQPVKGRIPSPPPASPPPGPNPEDQVSIRAAEKKMWRNVEWASFGGQMVGGALVLAHQGGIGLAIFAASSGAMVYAGYKGRRV